MSMDLIAGHERDARRVSRSALALIVALAVGCGGGGGGGGGGAVGIVGPSIQSITPLSGFAGDTVILQGVNFDSRQTNVSFAGVSATVLASTASTLTVEVPGGLVSGFIDVVATVAFTSSPPFTFESLGTPTLTRLTPNVASVGDVVIIEGLNFSTSANGSVIFLGGAPLTPDTASTTELRFTVPNVDAGLSPFDLSVQVGALTTATSLPLTLQATGAVPLVTSLTPATAAPGDTIVVGGGDFSVLAGQTDRFNTVFFGGTAVQPQFGGTTSALTVTVPNLGAGTVAVTVLSEGKRSITSQNFTVSQAAPPPQLTSVSPAIGIPGASVTLIGQNFDPNPVNNVVDFGGVSVTPFSATATQLQLSVPQLPVGGVTIAVSVGGQLSNSLAFDVLLPGPSLTVLTPLSGAVGSTVSLIGSGFSTTPAANLVQFGGVAASVTASSATSVTVIVPPVNPGAINVTVTVGGAGSLPLAFNVTALASSTGSIVTGGGSLAGGSLTVRVVDEVSGVDLPNATVILESGGGTTTATTNAFGLATFASVTGPVNATAGASGFALCSLVGFDAREVTLPLEPLATNHLVRGQLLLPDGVPSLDPNGASAPGGVQWFALVGNSQQPRVHPLRDGQSPFLDPSAGGNNGGVGQSVSFSVPVFDNVAFRLGFSLIGVFSSGGLFEQILYEVQIQSQGAVTSDVDLGSFAFNTTAINNGANVTVRRLANGSQGTVNGLPVGTLGNEQLGTLVNSFDPQGFQPLTTGVWFFFPFSSAGNATDAYFFNDPAASALKVASVVGSDNGLTGGAFAQALSLDVQDLVQANPFLPRNVALPPIPTLTAPQPGLTGFGLTPTFSFLDNGLFTNSSGFTELNLDQLDGSTVRAWRLVLAPGLTDVTLPSLPAALGALRFQQGAGFGTGNQVRLILNGLELGPGFDFNNGDFDTNGSGAQRLSQVIVGYSP